MSKWKQVVKTHQLEDYLQIIGYPCSPVIQCKDQNKHISNAFRTLFLQEMIRNGILIPYISISFSHGTKEVDETIAALEQVCKVYKKALEENIDHYLIGSPVKPVFRRYN
jgi:glutamate-1-semialdehyde 2,1-aminomutase